MSAANFSLMIHGGAGGASRRVARAEGRLRDSMARVLEEGRGTLANGGSALDAVQRCVMLLEDDPLFNAGCGAIPNHDGAFELDAAIMDGADLAAGAVAAARNIRNPVALARRVMQETPHVLLSGEGALAFAREQGVEIAPDSYFREGRRIAEEAGEDDGDRAAAHGTVGAVAFDLDGNLAAATSTGGWTAKMPGRIGDTPIPGAGTYADNRACALSCTGRGEDFLRTRLAAHAASAAELLSLEAPAIAERAIHYLAGRVKGSGAFILIDRSGTCAAAQTTDLLRHGWIEHGGEAHISMKAKIAL
jgi:beta-aspartyl-peptidase (threonine type)